MKARGAALAGLATFAASLALAQQDAPGEVPAAVAICVRCHGTRGEGNAAAGFPRVGGQSATYLARQLEFYADGKRNNAVMSPIAKQLSDAQRLEAATYFASVPAQSPVKVGSGNMPRAPRFYTIGDSALRVQACANCHGPGGRGEPPDYPYLAGQVQQYTIAALNEFRSGARNTDPSGQMQAIARKLRDADINVLAAYLAALPAPPPAPTWSEARYVTPHFVVDAPIAGTRDAEDWTNPVPK